jgi:uncharacterized membrane protein
MSTRKSSYGAIAKVGGGMLVFGVIVTVLHAIVVAISVIVGVIVGMHVMAHICILRYKDYEDME